MDQNQEQLDPEVAQEVISLLNKKITNLRNENSQLQTQLFNAPVKTEDGAHEVSGDNDATQLLIREIEHLRFELERRPDPEEVAMLEEKLKKNKQRRQESEQNLRSQVDHLHAELEETESAMQRDRAVKKALEKEIKTLCNDLNQRTREKEEALARLESQRLDNFDVRRFLRGELEELPPMPNPVVVTVEGKPRFKGVIMKKRTPNFILSVNGANTIKWANKGGGCVVPFPSVMYNGKKHLAEKSCWEPSKDRSYELFGIDGHCVYYGTYRCTKVATMDWGDLKSFGQEFVDAFLETTAFQDGHAAPVIKSLVNNMYRSGILKACCAVLRCEGFDDAIVKEVQSADGLPEIRNMLMRNSGKRPNDDHQSGEGSQRTNKRPRLSNKGKTRALHSVRK